MRQNTEQTGQLILAEQQFQLDEKEYEQQWILRIELEWVAITQISENRLEQDKVTSEP